MSGYHWNENGANIGLNLLAGGEGIRKRVAQRGFLNLAHRIARQRFNQDQLSRRFERGEFGA